MTPFKIGDHVRFEPAIGLLDGVGRRSIESGDTGVLTRISEDDYFYLDDVGERAFSLQHPNENTP